MKSLLAALLLSSLAFAQHDMQKSQPQKSEAQKSFDILKTLGGSWQGPVSVDPPQPAMGEGTVTQVQLRVTSRGNAIVHEMHEFGKPDDPAKYDHPLTMLYLDSGQLTLVHYCDAGNRPRMIARPSADGKSVEFDFIDLAGGTQYGHMHHAVFTLVDANHHVEDWTYMLPGDKPVHAHMELKRTP